MEDKKVTIKGFKAFDKDFKCRGMQYKTNSTFKEDVELLICEEGLHFCEMPLNVFNYYSFDSRFAKVEAVGDIEKEGDKVATNELRVIEEITLSQMFKAHFDLVLKKIKTSSRTTNTTEHKAHVSTSEHNAHANTTGNGAYANTVGYNAHANTAGNEAHANTVGYNAHASTAEYKSYANTAGNYSHANTSGSDAYANTSGYNAHASALGSEAYANTSGNYSHANTSGNEAHANTSGHNAHANASGKYAHVNTAGNYSHANTSGSEAHVNTLGNYAHANASGDYAHVSTAGDYAHANASGNYAHASASGYNTISASVGRNGKAKSVNGWIVIADWRYEEGKYNIKRIYTAKVGDKILGVRITPDTWYWFEDRKLKSEK
jgi:hypothetical protein